MWTKLRISYIKLEDIDSPKVKPARVAIYLNEENVKGKVDKAFDRAYF